ncbi:MAG TPA: TRAP transporter permease [Atribacterota bacterium]|nr:TRAP transporter permease [Atribacterota bacterium]
MTSEKVEIIESEEHKYRKFYGKMRLFVLVFSVVTSLIHLWLNSFGLVGVVQKNVIHLALFMALAFLIIPATSRSPKNKPSFFDWIFFALALSSGIYFFYGYFQLTQRMMMTTTYDMIYGTIVIFLIIEAARRAVGLPLTTLSVLFLIYVYVGPYMPGFLKHQGFSLQRILIRMTMTSEGILGVAAMVSASYVFMFILFSSFLRVSGASGFFNDFATAISGTARGGPAKIAIFASALTGMINGSAQANVVTTGSFTIPLMKKVGYEPYFAGAVEAIASTGGILMPPIMGAAAFIMSSYTGIPFSRIMLAAVGPSVLYYFTLFCMVDLRAAKKGLRGMPKEDLPDLKQVILSKGHMLIPVFLIILFLVLGFSPIFAAFVGIISVILASFLRKETRLSLWDIIKALEEGAQNAMPIAIICGIVGFIIGSVCMTGLGQVIGYNIVHFAGGNLFLTCFFTMLVAIILGMGLPGTAAYIVTATIAAPALILLGQPVLSAHFFVFYFGIMSAVIPPVALTSFTAAALAKADTNKVAIYGLFLGSAGLLLPYMFIYNPVILWIDFNFINYICSTLSLAAALFFMSTVIIGIFKKPLMFLERIGFAIVSVLLIVPIPIIRIFGFIFGGIMVYAHLLRSK